MMNATIRALRISKLNISHAAMNGKVTLIGQTLASLSAQLLNVGVDLGEKQLSLLVDEGLVLRSVGSRGSSLYTLTL